MKRVFLFAAAIFGIIVLSGCMCKKQPSVFVTATYPGAGSEKIVDTVATPIEAEMNRLDNLLYLSSESSDAGKYRLTLQFKHGTDMALAQVNVMNGIKRVEASLPKEVRMFGIHVTSDAPEDEKNCKTNRDRILTRDGLPVAQIVVEKGGDLTEQYAAKELQFWLKKITGAELPIVHTVADDRLNLIVGGGWLHSPADVIAIGETDGFAVRQNGNIIRISGNRSKGTLHGIYAFLEENTDIIWLRPDPALGTVYSNIPTLAVKKASFRSVPTSRLRGIGFTVHGMRHEPEWAARNRMNAHSRIGSNKPSPLANDYPTAGGGHGLRMFLHPKEYFATNPDFFVMKDGKRITTGQLCFTNRKIFTPYMKNLREHLNRNPLAKGVNLSCEDSWTVCDCPPCLKPIKLKDGTVIRNNDPRFRSAQYFRFLNEVAILLKRTHPDVTILTYAYYCTAVAPPFPIEDNIRIQFCPYDKDNKKPLRDLDRNGGVTKRLTEWAKASPMVWLREYYGCAAGFPRPLEEVLQDDFRFCRELGVIDLNTEWPVDHSSSIGVWDNSAITAWCMARLWWNCDADISALRDQFITRVYREAAPAMKRYYETIRKNWYASDYPSIYMDQGQTMAQMYLFEAGDEEICRTALEEAGKLAQHPVSRELIRRHREQFESWMSVARNNNRVSQRVPFFAGAEIKPDAACWQSAVKLPPFQVHGKKGETAKFRTDVRVLHDMKNLYIRFDNFADDAEKLVPSKRKADGGETFPRGDIMEFFAGDSRTGVYYQFAFDVGNTAVYDGKVFDSSWSGKWERNILRQKDRWIAVVKIPFSEIGVDPLQNHKLLFLPVRGKYYDTERLDKKTGKMVPSRVREMSSWGAGTVHEASSFGELVLDIIH